jgi:hypothetical protein
VFVENVSAYFDSVSGFALDATFDPAGANTAVKVIFDEAYIAASGIGGTNPVALGKASDFASGAATIGKQLVIGASTFVIRGREPVDDGVCVQLELERQ